VAREKQGRNVCSTLLIVDAQSVKNADTAACKGYDAGKKVSGIKRHIVVDTLGLPHAVAVTTAEVTDRQGALMALDLYEVWCAVLFVSAAHGLPMAGAAQRLPQVAHCAFALGQMEPAR
jgi:hypothetical protein